MDRFDPSSFFHPSPVVFSKTNNISFLTSSSSKMVADVNIATTTTTTIDHQSIFPISYSLRHWLVKQGSSMITPCSLDTIESQAAVAEYFVDITNKQLINLKFDSLRFYASYNTITLDTNDINDKMMKWDELKQVYTAERNVWSLLEIFTRSSLFHDIDDERNQRKVEKVIQSVSIHSSIPEIINLAFQNDDRLRKGAILLEWLEKSARDNVEDIPVVSSEPWSSTIDTLLKSKSSKRIHSTSSHILTSVQSAHPDAQLSPDLQLLPLQGDDAYDQEMVLKLIWQLIRSGQIKRAQEIATNHHIYWLAGSLLGGGEAYYVRSEISDDQTTAVTVSAADANNGMSRLGNIRKPQWMRTCWKYSQKLSDNIKNHQLKKTNEYDILAESRSTGIYEMTIYATLSDNLNVLLKSGLVTKSWPDKVWAVIKCSHDRDLMRVIATHRARKYQYSSLFPDCEESNIKAEQEIISNLDKTLETPYSLTGNCIDILKRVPPPEQESAEAYLLTLQASIMSGRTGIKQFIQEIEYTIKDNDNGVLKITNWPILLRVYCQVLLWMKYSVTNTATASTTTSSSVSLADLVPNTTLYLCLNRHIQYLVEQQQYSDAIPYLVFLPRAMRVSNFAFLLKDISLANLFGKRWVSSQTSQTESNVILELMSLGQEYFSYDMENILDLVILSKRRFEYPIPFQQQQQQQQPQQYSSNTDQSRSTQNTVTQGISTPGSKIRPYSLTSATKVNVGHTPYRRNYFPTPYSTNKTNHPTSTPTPYSNIRHHRDFIDMNVNNNTNNNAITGLNQSIIFDQLPLLAKIDWSAYGFVVSLKQSYSTQEQNNGSSSNSNNHHDKLDYHGLCELVGKDDMIRIASIQWLFLDESYAIQSIHNIHLLMQQLYEESQGSKLLQLQVILIAYILPSIEHFDSLDIIHRKIQSRNDSIATPSVEVMTTEEEELVAAYEVELTLSHFWRSFMRAMETVSTYNQEVKDYHRSLEVLIGSKEEIKSSVVRYRIKIERQARVALGAIIACIQCSPFLQDANGNPNIRSNMITSPANGISEVWHINRNNLLRIIHSLVQSMDESMTSPSQETEFQSSSNMSEEEMIINMFKISSEDFESIHGMMEEISNHITNISKVAIPGGPDLDKNVINSIESYVTSIQEKHSQSKSYKIYDDEDVLSWIQDTLLKVKVTFQDIQQTRRVQAMTTNSLLSQYLKICLETAAIVEKIGDSESTEWYKLGIKLADLIANEDPALLLDRALTRNDMEKLLESINQAYKKSMDQ